MKKILASKRTYTPIALDKVQGGNADNTSLEPRTFHIFSRAQVTNVSVIDQVVINSQYANYTIIIADIAKAYYPNIF